MSFFSGLLSHAGCPRNIYLAWRKRTFDLVTCEEQICEIREVSRRKKFAEDIDPNDIGVLINSMRRAR
jgi:predicted nucleic acid-binding protein